MDREERRRKLESTRCAVYVQQRHWWKKREIENERRARREKVRGEKGGGNEMVEAHEGSSPCMAASSTYRLPLTGCTIAIASTFFAPPPTCLSSTRILHLQGGVTLKTLPVLNYSVPLSFSLSSSSSSTSFYPSFSASSLRQTSSPPSRFSPHLSVFVSILPSLVFVFFIFSFSSIFLFFLFLRFCFASWLSSLLFRTSAARVQTFFSGPRLGINEGQSVQRNCDSYRWCVSSFTVQDGILWPRFNGFANVNGS